MANSNIHHNTPSLLVPAICWLAFALIALWAPPAWRHAGLAVSMLAMGFFLVLPSHLAMDLLRRFLHPEKEWRAHRYVRITRGPGKVQHGADWRFLGVARKSE